MQDRLELELVVEILKVSINAQHVDFGLDVCARFWARPQAWRGTLRPAVSFLHGGKPWLNVLIGKPQTTSMASHAQCFWML